MWKEELSAELLQSVQENESCQKAIEQLGYDKIHQTHRSYAVNIDYMNDITPTSILIGKVEIPLSKAFSKTIMDKLKIF